jgi:Protein of unknown function (DUF1266)
MSWLKKLFGGGEEAEARQRMAADEHDARRRFAFGVLAMSYEVDPGYMPKHSATAIREWYGVEGREDLLGRIHDYIKGYNDSRAYDAFLGTFLARAGFGASLLSEAESWDLAVSAARTVQPAYASWGDFGQGFLAGHLAYHQSNGDDADDLEERRKKVVERIARHERELWPRTPFQTPL